MFATNSPANSLQFWVCEPSPSHRAAWSMERRPDPAYDFCDHLLAGLLEKSPWSHSQVIVAMQFLLPGRHAGPAGDVAKICLAAENAHPGLRTTMTKLVAEHPLLIDILTDR